MVAAAAAAAAAALERMWRRRREERETRPKALAQCLMPALFLTSTLRPPSRFLWVCVDA